MDELALTYFDPSNEVDGWTLERTADDIAALGLGPAFVFGHSAGGFIALHFALRHPELTRGLILCSTGASLEPVESSAPSLLDRGGPEAAAAAARVFGGDTSPETMADFMRQVAPYYAGPSHPEVPAELFPLSSFNPDLAAHFFGALAAHYDVRDRLHEIEAPTLVVTGAWDWVVPPERGRLLARELPNAELLELPDAGHFVYAEEPGPFLDAVRRLLRR